MTNKQIEHLTSNWENARLDTVACVPSGDKLVEAIRYLQQQSKCMFEALHQINGGNK